MAATLELLERVRAAARAHPLLTDAGIAVAATAIVLALAPGTAIVGLALLVLAVGTGVVRGMRRRSATRRRAAAARRRSASRRSASGARGASAR
jgi:hypothetical protein